MLPDDGAKAVVCDTAHQTLAFAGSVSRYGKRVEPGGLIVGDEVVTEGGRSRVLSGGAEVRYRAPGTVLCSGPDGPAWVSTIRTNRAKNPVAGDGTTYAEGYWGAPVASSKDSALDGANLFMATVDDTSQTQGFIYMQPCSRPRGRSGQDDSVRPSLAR